MILILEHGLDVPPHQGQEEGDPETGRYKVEQSRLSVFVDVHHKDGEEETGQISNECGREIEVGVALQTVVVSEKQSNENARYHNVSKAKHESWSRPWVHSPEDPGGRLA